MMSSLVDRHNVRSLALNIVMKPGPTVELRRINPTLFINIDNCSVAFSLLFGIVLQNQSIRNDNSKNIHSPFALGVYKIL